MRKLKYLKRRAHLLLRPSHYRKWWAEEYSKAKLAIAVRDIEIWSGHRRVGNR